jgi:hypothetical protein
MGRGKRRKGSTTSEKLQQTVKSAASKRPPQSTKTQTAVNEDSMRVKGSPDRISRRLMVGMLPETIRGENGVSKAAVSRYDMKRSVLNALKVQGASQDPSSVAQQMPVYSHRSQQGYQKAWKMFFTYVRENYGVTEVSRVTPLHVEDYMKDIIDRGVSLRTYKTYAAAMSKLEPAMNKVRRYPISYSDRLKDLRKVARKDLVQNDPRRAYTDPEASIAKIEKQTYRLAAYMQLEGGARISEISELTAARNLEGVKGGFGRIRLTNTKGGRVRTMKVSEQVYREVEKIINTSGKFEFTRANYAYAAREAFKSRGEEWNGTHGLRWNFAQKRFYELQSDEGMSFQEALKAVSLELGHSRPEITLHYLR